MDTAPPPVIRSPGALLRFAAAARRRDALLAGLLYSSHQLGEALVPVIIGAAVGDAIAGGSWPRLLGWLGVLAGDFLLLSLSYRFGARASMRAKQHAAHRVRLLVADRVLDPRGGADAPPGELLTRTSSDADRVGALIGIVASTVAAAVALAAATVLLFLSSWVLAVVVLAGTVALLVVSAALARPIAARSHAEQRGAAATATLAEDTLRGIRVIHGVGAEDAATGRYRVASGSAMAAALRATTTAAAVPAVSVLMTGAFLALVAIVGGYLALAGRLGLGELIAALGLARFLTGPLRTIGGATAAVGRAHASAARLVEVLNRPVAVADAGALAPAPTGDVEVDTPHGAIVFPGGRMTGVVAQDPRDAAGLVALLARELDPSPGAVRLGGTDLRHLSLRAARSAVVVSPHDAALFSGTIDEAIGAGASGAGGREPDAPHPAVAAAFVDELIDRLPDGRHGPVGEGGARLSGGERQRVALARALATDAAVLVLHDPTTAVDAVTEDIIAERLTALRRGSTTIVVTSSPALLARCDCVVAIGGGAPRIGDHATLLREDAAYRAAVRR